MGPGNPNRPNYPLRPATSPFASQQSSTPFSSSGPAVGSEAPAFRPGPPAASNFQAPPFAGGPLVGTEVPAFRPPPSIRSGEVAGPPPPPSYGPPTSGFQRFPNPPVSSAGQVPPPQISLTGHPVIAPPTRPPPGPASPFSHPQPPLVSMGSPPQSIKTGQPNPNIPPPADQRFSTPIPRPSSQPSSPPTGTSYPAGRGTYPGYPNMQPNSVSQAPPLPPASFQTQQGGYGPPMQSSFPLQRGYAPQAPPTSLLAQQRGYAPVPPVSTSSGLYSGNQFQQHGIAPAQQGLAEDFSSLSLGSVPGSYDAGLDITALPRPLDGDVEPKSYADMYPMNCDSRFLRLTTSGIPNSQSLASRWHLSIGAVVCPLAETPLGEEVPIVNFATTGIIRCRRCRTYVNPYVAFTDNGRKWRCNICSLLNDGKSFPNFT